MYFKGRFVVVPLKRCLVCKSVLFHWPGMHILSSAFWKMCVHDQLALLCKQPFEHRRQLTDVLACTQGANIVGMSLQDAQLRDREWQALCSQAKSLQVLRLESCGSRTKKLALWPPSVRWVQLVRLQSRQVQLQVSEGLREAHQHQQHGRGMHKPHPDPGWLNVQSPELRCDKHELFYSLAQWHVESICMINDACVAGTGEWLWFPHNQLHQLRLCMVCQIAVLLPAH
jgi:hypothetical protein